MRGRDLLVTVIASAVACGVLTACSSEPSPPPRPSSIKKIEPCDFFTADERDDYELHDGRPFTSPAGCIWEGTKFFKEEITSLTLTLLNHSADRERKFLGAYSGVTISGRPTIDGRRIWRIVTSDTGVKCTLLFAIDGSSSAQLELSQSFDLSDVQPTRQELCKGLDELAAPVERKLPAVHA